MKLKVTSTSNIIIEPNANTTSPKDTSSEESFQDVLELNQAALKAMTIDAMVAKSTTGSISPDAVDANAIMSFRSTLGSNIKAPVPTGYEKTDTKPDTTPNEITEQTAADIPADTDRVSATNTTDISGVYNEGLLKCSDELNRYFKEASDTYGVDVKLLKAMAYAESNFNPNITSSAGAKGILQMMPATAKSCGVDDPYDAYQCIMGGTKYMAKLIEKYDGDLSLALAAYNAGPTNVKKYNGIPPFKETQNHVKKVLNLVTVQPCHSQKGEN